MTNTKQPNDIPVRVDEITEGMLIDLYGDKFADPDRDPMKGYEYEYVEVLGIERETPDCIRLDYDGGACGFPPDHILKRKQLPKFKLVRLVDAYVRYEMTIEAASAESALMMLEATEYSDTPLGEWEQVSTSEYDDRLTGVEDMDGNELIEPRH